MPATEPALPNGASSLIALARVAHRDGNRQLEQAVLNKLACEYGLTVGFKCMEAVERDLHQTEGRRRD